MKIAESKAIARVMFVFLTIFCLLNQPIQAAAISSSKLDKFSANNIMFYDPDDNCENSTKKTCVTPSGDKITWIGDSLSALGGKDRLEKNFPGVDYGPEYNNQNSYIQSGKAITVNKTNDGGPSGLTILQKIVDAGSLRPYLVFALGTNEPWTRDSLDKVLALAGSKTQVIIMTSKTINYSAKYHYDYTEENKNLLAWAKEIDNLSVGDWASQLDDSMYAEDGVHYKDEVYDKYQDFIKGTLPKSCNGALCGKNAKERY